MSLWERMLRRHELRERGLRLVWQLSDEANLPNELERGHFILDRPYPEMPAPHREQFRANFAAEFAAGRWHGFRRPGTPDAPDDLAEATG
jgi:hypothetical protein